MLVIKDFATTTLASALTAVATTITVANGSKFPALAVGDYFYIVLQDFYDRNLVEVVKVTGVSGNVLTVVRGQDGTVGRAFAVGAYAELRLTVRTFAEFIAQSNVGNLAWGVATASVVAQPNKGYLVNAAGLTITLPASPVSGQTVGIGDYNGSNHSVTIARNGSNIMGRAENFIFNLENANVVFVYIDSTFGWMLSQGFGESQAPYAVFNKLHRTNALGQKTFPFASTAANTVDVYYNGWKLDPASDYTTTTAEVTLSTPVSSADDVIEIYGWNQALVLNADGITYDNAKTGIPVGSMQGAVDYLHSALSEQVGELAATAGWPAVPAFSDAELGGPDGPMNAQAKALAARTEYLDNKIPNAVNSFAALRTTTPEWAGQRIVLAGWNAGSILGAGEFIAFAGDVADDGGLTARVNAAWYWRRSNVPVLTPDMFGGYSDGSVDSVAAFVACEDAVNATGYSANYTGKWKLSRNVIIGSAHNRIVSSKTSYTGAGKLIVSGSEEGSYMRRKSSVSPVNSAPGNTYSQSAAAYHEFFVNQNMNNQGLAYFDGFYYVGYDTGGGNGIVERYGAGGHLDSSYGGVNIPINHAAELAFRLADQRVYVASGGGSEPTYVRKLAADGKSVAQSIDFTAYGNSALCAIDNVNDILILHSTLTGGDGGLPTFTFFSFSDLTTPLKQFTMPATLGVPQGMDVFENTIYFYTNNKVTMVTYDGELRGSFTIGTPGESEGLTIVADYANAYIAVGYNTPRRVMTVRSPHGMISKGLSCLVNMNPQIYSNVSKIPCIIPFGFRKNDATAGGAWVLTTYADGKHPGFANVWYAPTINSAQKRVEAKLRVDQIDTCASAAASFNGQQYALTGGPFKLMCDFANDTLYIYFYSATDVKVDPATIAGTAILWGQVIGGMSFNNAVYA